MQLCVLSFKNHFQLLSLVFFVTIHHWIFLSDSKQLPSIHLGLFRVSLGPCWPHILCVPPVEGYNIDRCLSLKTFTPSCPIFSLSKQYTHIDSWLFSPPLKRLQADPILAFQSWLYWQLPLCRGHLVFFLAVKWTGASVNNRLACSGQWRSMHVNDNVCVWVSGKSLHGAKSVIKLSIALCLIFSVHTHTARASYPPISCSPARCSFLFQGQSQLT